MSTPIKLAIVAPCYNEQDMLPISAPKLVSILHKLMDNGKITQDSFLLFVNDGSKDETWSIIEQLHNESPSLCHGINLSRNCGHQNAIMAGMQRSIESPLNADAVITIDIDLQDPLECIPIMVDDCLNRNDVVYGVRSSRKSDSFLKRFTAESFYKFQSMMGVNTIYNHADFRLMTRRVVKELYKYSERNLYLRGVIPTIGYPHSIVYEERAQREAGKTKYTLKKMLSLAFDGISSFSVRPIYLILMGGGVFMLLALIMGLKVLLALINGSAIQGWASIFLSIWFVGGAIMVSIGMVGLYVGKTYIETKHRPRYHIMDEI